MPCAGLKSKDNIILMNIGYDQLIPGSGKDIGVCLFDLIECPVFNLKNDKACFFAVQDEVRLPIIDVRRVPGDIAGIGFGMRFEKGVELFFTLSLKFFYILRDHEGYVSPAKVSNPGGLGP